MSVLEILFLLAHPVTVFFAAPSVPLYNPGASFSVTFYLFLQLLL
jgi:hypothetical protein